METEEKRENVDLMQETEDKKGTAESASEEKKGTGDGKPEVCETAGTEKAEMQKSTVMAPFLHSKDTTAVIMRDVAFALIPAALFGVYRFGFRAFLILLLSVTSCVLTEHVCKRIRKVQSGGYECSGIVTGLLLGMMLPLNVPYWLPIAGGVFSIGIVKMLFGGLGRNRLNPAATAKCVCFVLMGFVLKTSMDGYLVTWSETELGELFFGFGVGMIGEVSAFLILLGGLYLVLCGVITLHTPVAYLLSFSAVLLMFGNHGFDMKWLAMHLCIGGVMLGAFFLANDYSTTPMTKSGKIIFGALVGAVTAVLRIFDFTVEAVAAAIVVGNCFAPLIDRLTFPRSFGKGRKANL
ncbi:MAG: RnfABCDGE type electron transport complex subunit D [Lachnospiraceae bacterium]|nr:RnfABCDGE type electron transport complex subunit D [Lachnospiraceae bacterium]